VETDCGKRKGDIRTGSSRYASAKLCERTPIGGLMGKFSAKTAIGDSYSFLFRRIGSIAGAIWLPLVINLAIGFLFTASIVQIALAADRLLGSPVIGPGYYTLIISLPIFILGLIFNSMAWVGVMRISLGQTQRTFVFFSLGKQVWRMIAAKLLVTIIAVAVGAALAAIFVAVFRASGMPTLHAPSNLAGWLMFPANSFLVCKMVGVQCPSATVIASLWGLLFLEVCIWIYIALRVQYFFPVVVMAENRVSLKRSWELSGANFLPIVALLLCTTVPLEAIFFAINHYVRPTLSLAKNTGLFSQPGALSVLAPILANPLGLLLTTAIGLVGRTLNLGLTAGGLVRAYRDVTAKVPAEQEQM